MKSYDPRKKVAILRVLRTADRPLGGARVARELQAFGMDLKPRTLRVYLEHLEANGLVESDGQRGRRITPRGIEELQKGTVIDRLGFTAARVDALAYQTTFHLTTGAGRIVVNASMIDEADLRAAISEM
ncbi:MAG TPA: winged-helix domain-containing protein, partial [Phycisphaerae bacterium]|nr:winged-helix domain-containing protein [Phycisphaerae bacterium]